MCRLSLLEPGPPSSKRRKSCVRGTSFSEIRVREGEDQWLWVRDGAEKSGGGLKSFGSTAGAEGECAGLRTQRRRAATARAAAALP